MRLAAFLQFNEKVGNTELYVLISFRLLTHTYTHTLTTKRLHMSNPSAFLSGFSLILELKALLKLWSKISLFFALLEKQH